MPWEIRRGTSQCSGYGVFKEGTSELEGCHTTREAAQRQMAALYASEPEAAQKDVITNEVTPNRYPDYIGPKKKKIVSKMMEPGTFVEGDFAMGSVDDDVYVGQIVHIMTDGMLGIEGSKMTIMASPQNPAILIRIFEQHEDGYWKETHLFTGFDSMTGSKIDPLPMKAEYFSMGGTEITGNENTRDTQQEFVNDMMERIGKSMNEDLKEAMEILKSLEKGYKDKGKSMHEDDMEDDDDEEMKEKGYKGKKNKSIDSDSAQQTDVPSDLSAIFTNMPRHAKRVNTTGNAPVNFTFLQGDK